MNIYDINALQIKSEGVFCKNEKTPYNPLGLYVISVDMKDKIPCCLNPCLEDGDTKDL
jgi:hypothetical protein